MRDVTEHNKLKTANQFVTALPSSVHCANAFESPEERFLRASRECGIYELILLGFELCGTYDLTEGVDKNGASFVNRPPLTSLPGLKAYLDAMEGAHGVKQARRALKYVMPNSASPRESALAMLLCLPYSLGGYNLDRPLLNQPILLRKKASRVAEKHYYVCDLYWPDCKTAVEYDSDLCHTGSERIASDSKRRNALSFLGITVVTVTRRQANNIVEMDKAARILARHLNRRIRPRTDSFMVKQLVLRSAVL